MAVSFTNIYKINIEEEKKNIKNKKIFKKSDSQTIEEVKKAENIIHLEYK